MIRVNLRYPHPRYLERQKKKRKIKRSEVLPGVFGVLAALSFSGFLVWSAITGVNRSQTATLPPQPSVVISTRGLRVEFSPKTREILQSKAAELGITEEELVKAAVTDYLK